MAKNKKREARVRAAGGEPRGPSSAPMLRRLGYPALTAWAAVVLFYYFRQNYFFRLDPFFAPLWLANLGRASELLKYVPQLALLGVLSLFSFSAGALLLKAAAGGENRDLSALDWLLFSMGLGFGALSLLTLGLGAAGQLNRTALLVLLGCGFAAGAFRFRADILPRLKELDEEIKGLRFSAFDKVLLALLLFSGAAVLMLTLSPEIFFDSLVYHLGVPAYYINEGRLLASPDNLHSASPLLLQMLYAAGLLLSGDTLAKLLHFATGFWLCATMFAMGRRYASVTAGLLACVIYAGMPMAGMNLGTTGVEVGSSWFTLLAAYALVLFSAREKGEPRLFDRTLLLAGIMAGLASGTKYTALFAVVAGMGLMFLNRPGEPSSGRAALSLKRALFFGAAAGLVFSPWMIKDLLFHGNPLYPYFGGLFGGHRVDPYKWALLNSDCYARDLHAAFSSLSGFFQFLFHPWYLTMSGAGNADFVGPAILVCAPLTLAAFYARPPLKHLAFLAAAMWALWAFSTTMPRYLLTDLALFSVIFAAIITGAPSAFFRWTFQGLLALVCFYGAQWVDRTAASQGGWRVVFGYESRDHYLSVQHQSYPTPYYPAMEYINSSLPRDSRVLFLGESRGFYCGRRFITSSVYDESPLVRFARESATPEELEAKVKAAGITDLFLNLGEAMRVDQTYRLFGWDERSIKVFDGWWNAYVRQLWSDTSRGPDYYRLLFVYRVADKPTPGPAPHNYLDDLYLRSLKK